ncbi:hypothetical protein FOXB_15168 [Fusarium oxysporum f. sp. conglutinans Fo5176]|uniref:Uncharacterized protein n=1 Tax=Fusarium oxysporum (strain Fo5176) TaxID=660025 RepID=F9G936_FUSOF|nr:hypothetical protein FOXB_15168 [Fusarium oxysporum f. sp. conglutinans Fo5176]
MSTAVGSVSTEVPEVQPSDDSQPGATTWILLTYLMTTPRTQTIQNDKGFRALSPNIAIVFDRPLGAFFGSFSIRMTDKISTAKIKSSSTRWSGNLRRLLKMLAIAGSFAESKRVYRRSQCIH